MNTSTLKISLLLILAISIAGIGFYYMYKSAGAEEESRSQTASESVIEKRLSSSPPSDPFEQSDFVYIEAGSFTMGSVDSMAYPDEQPTHEVTITRPFYLGKTEVTQAQWEAIMGSNPSNFKGSDRPVDGIGWHDIQEFLKILNEVYDCASCFRLPTEAEWEYAARAGTTSGITPVHLSEYAWFADNAAYSTHPVGQKKPNAWGLYDMQGNVYEWVQDRYSMYDQEPEIDPLGPAEGPAFVLRGGSWTDAQRELRVTYRDYYAQIIATTFLDFAW